MKAFTYIYILIQILNVAEWGRVSSNVYLLHHTINLVLYFNSEGKRLEVRFLIWFANCKKVLNVIMASTHILSSRKSCHNEKFKYNITGSVIGLQCRVFKTFYEIFFPIENILHTFSKICWDQNSESEHKRWHRHHYL